MITPMPENVVTKKAVAKELINRLIDERIRLMDRIREIDISLEELLPIVE